MAGRWRAEIVKALDNVGAKNTFVKDEGLSNDNNLLLRGKGTPGKLVNVYESGQLIGTAKVNSNGRWSFETGTLEDGQYSFTAAVVRNSGRLMKMSDPFDVTIDTTAKALDQFEIAKANDQHFISGLAEANAKVSLYDDGVKVATVTADSDGQFQFVLDDDATRSERNISLQQEDAAGNISQMGTERALSSTSNQSGTNTPLKAPTVNPGDFDGLQFVLSGTVELSAGDQFTVEINGQSYSLDDGIVINGSSWELAINAGGWPAGNYEVKATLSNANESIQDQSTGEVNYNPEKTIGQAGIDSDGDEVPDDIDIDDDNDGILDIYEGTGDLDKDGIINALDLDSDGDGIADNIEAQTTSGFKDPIVFVDMDGDGLNDIYDSARNNQDPTASKGIELTDTDSDRQFDFLDLDSDNDGLLDINESGVPFDDFSTNYQLLTGGYLPEDLADTFGSEERDYREATPISNKSIGPVKDIDSSFNQVLEGSAIGTKVGLTAHAIDPDNKDIVSYELLDDADGRFGIHPETGVVTLTGNVNYDSASEHKITVLARSSDGSSSKKEFTIGVLEDNQPIGPVIDIDNRKNIVSETDQAGTRVGIKGYAEDPDADDKVSYSLFDDADGRFKINSKTGVVTLAKELDYNLAQSHQITIKAESTDGTVSAETFTIEVEQNNPIGPVVDTDSNDNQIKETAAIGSKVGLTANAVDPDQKDTVSYKLIDDAGGRFEIDEQSGVVTLAKDIDYDNASSHEVTVKAISSDDTSSIETFTINVLSDKPIGPINDIDQADNKVSECSEVGSYVGITAEAIDPDTAGQITYKLLDDAGGRFTIDSKTGEIFTAKELDYETLSHHNIKIEASSPDGTSSSTNMRIDVVDKETFIEFDSMPKHDVAIILANGNYDGYDTDVTVSGRTNLPEGTIIYFKQTYAQPEVEHYPTLYYTNYFQAEVRADGSFSKIVELAHYPDDKVFDHEGSFTNIQPDGYSNFTVENVVQPNGKPPCDLSKGTGYVDVENSFSWELNSPLVLDLNNDGVQTVTLDKGVYFDVDGNGEKRATAWISKEDAFLAFDRNGDGIINSDLELFGTNTELADGSLAKDGFDALKDLDSNGDGIFDKNDEQYDDLLLWQDSNQNGISEANELSSLSDRGVAAIFVDADRVAEYSNQSFHGLRSSWLDDKGESHDIDDVWFRIGDYLDEPNQTDLGSLLDSAIESLDAVDSSTVEYKQPQTEASTNEADNFDHINELDFIMKNEDLSIQHY